MRGIGELVVAEQPHIVCFQEVTPRIQTLFAAAAWWASYDVSDAPHGAPYYTLLLVRRPLHAAPRAMTRAPFSNSCQGRDLLCATLELGGGVRLMAATSHLESYMGPGATSSAERVEQMRQALQLLTHAGRAPANVVLAGDANWDDATDGDLARLLPPGWRDAWAALHPGEPGFTYDGPANAMLLNSLKKRLDRVLFRLADYEPAAVAMVGRAPLAGAFYEKRLRGGATKRLPVCCSDHFGLLFTMRRAPRRVATAA
jgi:endonuclease/exonuclease/phosphatase family metal-dependent hydrolase